MGSLPPEAGSDPIVPRLWSIANSTTLSRPLHLRHGGMSGPPGPSRLPGRLPPGSYGSLAAPSGADSQHLLMTPSAWERRVHVPFCVKVFMLPFLLLGVGLVGGYIYLSATGRAAASSVSMPVLGVLAVAFMLSVLMYQKRIHVDPSGVVFSYGAPGCFCYRASITVSSIAEIEVRSTEVGDENGINIRYQVVVVSRTGSVVELSPYDEVERAEAQAGDLRQLLGLESATAV